MLTGSRQNSQHGDGRNLTLVVGTTPVVALGAHEERPYTFHKERKEKEACDWKARLH